MALAQGTNTAGMQISARPFFDTLGGKAILTVAASLFVAACAHLIVPNWITPVPFTLADLAVILTGLLLGPVAGFSALALYLLEGATGMPVFSPTGPGGVAQLLGPTGGYLIAYPFAAALAGLISNSFGMRRHLRFPSALAGAALGSALLMISGTVWLGHLLHLSPSIALSRGMTPFLPIQCVKVFAAAGFATSLSRLRRL